MQRSHYELQRYIRRYNEVPGGMLSAPRETHVARIC